MIILCDVDGTVARLHDEWYARYNKDYDDNLTYDKVTSWSLHKFVKPECGTKIYDYLKDPTLYKNVQPYNGALRVITELRKMGHRVIFASAGIPNAAAKHEWLKEKGFLPDHDTAEPDFVVIYDKSLLKGDFLIDDRDKNVADFNHNSILMDRPWNRSFTWKYRAFSWVDVLVIIVRRELGYYSEDIK